MGQRYRSGAVVSDGSPEPEYTRDPELYYHPTTWPGARLPHCWLGDSAGHKVSTHDIVGKGRFALLTGISGQRWADAAQAVGGALGIPITAHVVGPGRPYIDLYDDWARLREVGEDGCVLVRPDAHVAWRAAAMADDPAGELEAVLGSILDRPGADVAAQAGSTNSAGSLENPAATAAS
jgi:2,4-dichlorophenol 6-monooxygenase